MNIQEQDIANSRPEQPPKNGYNLSPEQEIREILRKYRLLLKGLNNKLKEGDRELIHSAFKLSADAHKSMRRKSGEPYIMHPLAVAMICIEEIGLGVRSTICALLHDTVEDTDLTLETIKKNFGGEIAKIVDGLTKISNVIDTNKSMQAENFKKILLTLTDDPRVILIKMADRLHNMRTLDSMKKEKQIKVASETVWVYAPLAHRMGLYSIKSELEDLSMKYLEPEAYKDIAKKLAETKRERTRYINEFIKPLKDKLSLSGYQFDIYGRPKSIHSIWNKIKNKKVAFEEVYDLFAIRIILDAIPENEKEQCWKVYSMITDEYNPSPERLRDWLSNPKSNGYEALHTTVMGPQGKWVEVQIRTKRMNEIAEKGLAAHFKYKEGQKEEDPFDKWFSHIRESINHIDTDSVTFLNQFKEYLLEEIYVYTPKGEVKMLPIGSSALDFAFSVHSEVGLRCIGAKVHHKLVPISHKLKSGDQVEIITSGKQKPSQDWLNIVITAKAKNKIKDSLKEEKRKIAEDGKILLQKKFENFGISFIGMNIDEVVNHYKQNSHLDLFYKIAMKEIELADLVEFKILGDKWEAPKIRQAVPQENMVENIKNNIAKKDNELIIFEESSEKIVYSLGKCCNPIPGDAVFGFVSTGKGLVIHRTNCPNATQLAANYGHRIVKTKWAKNRDITFLSGITVVGLDDIGIINKITTIISGELKINISALSFDTDNGIFNGVIKVFVKEKDELENLVNRLREVKDIYSVERLDI